MHIKNKSATFISEHLSAFIVYIDNTLWLNKVQHHNEFNKLSADLYTHVVDCGRTSEVVCKTHTREHF